MILYKMKSYAKKLFDFYFYQLKHLSNNTLIKHYALWNETAPKKFWKKNNKFKEFFWVLITNITIFIAID